MDAKQKAAWAAIEASHAQDRRVLEFVIQRCAPGHQVMWHDLWTQCLFMETHQLHRTLNRLVAAGALMSRTTAASTMYTLPLVVQVGQL